MCNMCAYGSMAERDFCPKRRCRGHPGPAGGHAASSREREKERENSGDARRNSLFPRVLLGCFYRATGHLRRWALLLYCRMACLPDALEMQHGPTSLQQDALHTPKANKTTNS